MTTNSRNYQKLKSILQAISPGEDNPFPLWKPWAGEFSLASNYPIRNGVELTLINRSSKHCICGHWTGKRDKNPLGKIAACSTPDPSVNNEETVAGELELRRVREEKEKLLLEKHFEDCSLIPYYLGNKFLLSGKKCSEHFKGTSEASTKEKIIYIRQGKTITASRIQLVFDKSGLRQKLIEVSRIRHLPENLMYFTTCVGSPDYAHPHSQFAISRAVDPFGYKDICGIHKIHKKKKIKSPITIDGDSATVMCKYAGFAELGDMLYIKLNFIGDTRFPSIGVIQEHQVFSRSPTIPTDDIAEMRGGLNSDSDSDSD